jgi:hypothetical protein
MTEPVTPLNNDDSWKDTLAGDDADKLEALSGFNSPDDLFTNLADAQNFDWRSEAAGDDDKFKSTLERFESLSAFGNSFRDAQQTIRSGQLKEPLAADASDEQKQAYREANGIPLEADGYLENLPDGLVVGDEDREIMTDFMGALHNVNADPTIAVAAIEWYNRFAEQQQDELASADQAHQVATEDALRAEWGTDYRTNVNVIGAMFEKGLNAEDREFLMNARGPDGQAVFNRPGIMQFFAEKARAEMHPMAVPGQTHDPQQTVDNEIAEIEKVMREDRKAYNADEAMQARLRQLYEIRSKHQAA